MEQTPMGSFCIPEDLSVTVLWLMSPALAFVNGIIVTADIGFSAFNHLVPYRFTSEEAQR